jgi:hypothetical protein
MIVEAVLLVMSLSGQMLGVTHIGEPPGKTFASGRECFDWLSTEEAAKIIVDVSNMAQHNFPTTIRVVPVCHHPNQA